MNVEPSALHPQTKRHLLNREKLRTAAIREFAKHGLQGAKVSNIVIAAQLTQPSFYRAWQSKEAAYIEIVADTLQSWRDAAMVILAGPDTTDLEQRLISGLDNLYRALTVDIELTRMVLQEHNDGVKSFSPFIEIYTEVFANSQASKLISDKILAETLAQAFTALTARFFMARLYSGNCTVQQTTKEVVQLFLPLLTQEE